MLRRNNYRPFNINNYSNHDAIYHAAIMQDKVALDGLLLQSCIDMQDKRYMPPVTLLAEEGRDGAVEFLRKNYNASLKWIIFGYAKSGNTPAVVRMLKKFPQFLKILLPEVIFGYVLAGKITLALKAMKISSHNLSMLIQFFGYGWGNAGLCLAKFPLRYLDHHHRDRFSALLYGYAMGGHEKSVNEMITLYPQNLNNIALALRAYAICNHDKALDNLFKQYSSEYLVLLPEIIFGYAFSRSLKNLNQIYENNLMPEHSYNYALIEGFAAGGHIFEYEKVLQEQPTARQTELNGQGIRNFSLYGHNAYTKNLIKSFPEHDIQAVAGFLLQNDREAINHININDPHRLLLFLDEKIIHYASNNDQKNVIKILHEYYDTYPSLLHLAVATYAYYLNSQRIIDLFQEYRYDEEFGITIAYHLATARHTTAAFNFLNQYQSIAVAAAMASAFMQNCYFAEATSLLRIMDSVEDIATKEIKSHRAELLKKMAEEVKDEYANPINALIYFTHMPASDFRFSLNDALMKVNLEVNYPAIFRDATNLNKVSKRERLSFNQSVAWLSPDIQIWLLQGIKLFMNETPSPECKLPKLPNALFFAISSFLIMLDQAKINELGYKRHMFFQRTLSASHDKVKGKKNLPVKFGNRNVKPSHFNSLVIKTDNSVLLKRNSVQQFR